VRGDNCEAASAEAQRKCLSGDEDDDFGGGEGEGDDFGGGEGEDDGFGGGGEGEDDGFGGGDVGGSYCVRFAEVVRQGSVESTPDDQPLEAGGQELAIHMVA